MHSGNTRHLSEHRSVRRMKGTSIRGCRVKMASVEHEWETNWWAWTLLVTTPAKQQIDAVSILHEQATNEFWISPVKLPVLPNAGSLPFLICNLLILFASHEYTCQIQQIHTGCCRVYRHNSTPVSIEDLLRTIVYQPQQTVKFTQQCCTAMSHRKSLWTTHLLVLKQMIYLVPCFINSL